MMPAFHLSLLKIFELSWKVRWIIQEFNFNPKISETTARIPQIACYAIQFFGSITHLHPSPFKRFHVNG
jgi:hypothetical protein